MGEGVVVPGISQSADNLLSKIEKICLQKG